MNLFNLLLYIPMYLVIHILRRALAAVLFPIAILVAPPAFFVVLAVAWFIADDPMAEAMEAFKIVDAVLWIGGFEV